MTYVVRHPESAEDALASGAVSSAQLCELTGLTYRQVNYWAETGLLRASVCEARGSGTSRRYSAGDVARARVIKTLLDAGVSLQSVRRGLAMVGAASEDGLRWLVLSGAEPVAVAVGELERVAAEQRVVVVVDLQPTAGPSP